MRQMRFRFSDSGGKYFVLHRRFDCDIYSFEYQEKRHSDGSHHSEIGTKTHYNLQKNETRIIKGKKITYPEDGWCFSIELGDDEPCEKHLELIAERLLSNRELLQELTAMSAAIYIEIVIYSKNFQYHVCLGSSLMKTFGELGLDLWYTYMF